MTLRDDVAELLRDGEPRTIREITMELYGPLSDGDAYIKAQAVGKGCRQLAALGVVDMIGKTRRAGQFIKVYRWRSAS